MTDQRATRRREPELSRSRRSDCIVHAESLVVEHDGEHQITTVEIDRLDCGTARAHAHFVAGDGEGEIGIRGRVDDDVDGHHVPRDRGPGGSDVGLQPSTFIDPHYDDARWDILANDRTDGFRPVTGGREGVEDRAEQGVAGPPKEVGELLVAPIPRAFIKELAVVGQRLDHLGRQTQRFSLLAAHGMSFSATLWTTRVQARCLVFLVRRVTII